MIARRVFLDKLPVLDAKGRGTLDATLHLQDGLIALGQLAGQRARARDR